MQQKLIDIAIGSWQVLGEMAPYLLLGFLIAGVLHVLVSPAWVQRHLGGRGIVPVIKATLLGVPLPLCSCGVIPVTAGMYRQGASRGATTGFLLATPQTGVDSIAATWALMGPVFGIVRPLVALVTGIVGGAIIDKAVHDDVASDAPEPATCSDCCDDEHDEDKPQGHVVNRVLRYGLVTLPGDIARALIIGILIAGVIGAFVQQGQFAQYLGAGIGSMLIMMLIGTPIYVCSTASIPLAVAFMHMGASPGAALVFLITGPATNAATLSVTWKLLGRKTTVIYLLVVVISAIAGGYLLDMIDIVTPMPLGDGAHHHHESISLFHHVSAAALALILVYSIIARRRSTMTEPTSDSTAIELNIEGMHCSHCVDTATKAIEDTDGVTSAQVDLATGRAVVEGDNVNTDALIRAVESVGYKASLS
jgi:uncharacterized membrane protein YraQ (UPF0718 family)/copper chaperone CopZ